MMFVSSLPSLVFVWVMFHIDLRFPYHMMILSFSSNRTGAISVAGTQGQQRGHLSYFMTDHRIFNKNNTADVTAAAETTYPSGASEFTPGLCWVPVALSWVFCVLFCRPVFVFVFLFGHYIACFSIYGFWVPLCCLWVPATLIAPVLLLHDLVV
jgi:hypothetical protein